MKYLAIVLATFFLAAAPAQAQTKISPEIGKAYYDSCMGLRDPRMSTESQDSLCTCTAAKMQETMSVENIRTMGQNDQAGREMLNKMLLDVYAPCMQLPIAEMVNDQCMMEDKMASSHMHKTDLCACVGDKTGTWFSSNGRDLMAQVLAENPNISDPMGPIMASKPFMDATFATMMECQPKPAKKR